MMLRTKPTDEELEKCLTCKWAWIKCEDCCLCDLAEPKEQEAKQ